MQGGENLTEDEVQRILQQHPPLKRHHNAPVYMPNLVRKIVRTCFMPQRPSNRAIDPIGHVLNKAWPMRCSVRNFSEIISGYILHDSSVYDFVCMVMHASMCGVYASAAVRAVLPLQILLYKYYVHARVSQHHLCEWVQQGHHNIVFVAIKEYIAFAVSMVPGLANVLQEDYGWESFVQSVTSQADAVRQELNTHMHTPGTMFSIAKQSILLVRGFKCPAPATNELAVCDMVCAIVRARCVPSQPVYTYPLRVKFFKVIRKVLAQGAPLVSVAPLLGVPAYFTELLSHVTVGHPMSVHWRQLRNMPCNSSEDALVIYEFTMAWHMSLRINTYDLPQHIQDMQRRTTTERSTTVYVCSCCRQIRAFVVDDGHAANNAWARGHQKVLLDDCTGILYCGRRVEKVSSHTRRVSTATESGRSYWKSQQSLMCGYCPLVRVELLGKLLSFYGKLYALCPYCMCTMLVTTKQYHGDAFCCVNCRYKTISRPQSICFHCCMETPHLSRITLKDATVDVCGTCSRWWMADTSTTQHMTEEGIHQAINERWAANRAAVYCESL